jgi:hypothetical protein
MPIRKLLEGSAFTPEEVQELAHVYHEVVTALSLDSPSDQEEAAKTIFLVASQQRRFDPTKIEDQTIAVLRR